MVFKDSPMDPLISGDYPERLMAQTKELVLSPGRLAASAVPVLFVSVCAERFALPQASISELIRIPAEKVKKHVEILGKAAVLSLRGSIIPLVRLADALGMKRFYVNENGRPVSDRRRLIADRRDAACMVAEDAKQWDEREREDGRRRHPASDLSIVVVNTGSMRYGLVVDELLPGPDRITLLK